MLKLAAAIIFAFAAGKLTAKLKLPAILGWLIAGMALGPHAFNLLSDSLLDSGWYRITESILECTVGLMIGTELLWGNLKHTGKQILITTVTESLGTFFVVSLVFAVLFHFAGLPVYLAFMFGGIALATAPAPSLSIVNEMKASGPVTNALIPMAALDDLVGALVFFVVIALVSAHVSTEQVSVFFILFLVFLPVLIGIATGFLTGKTLQKRKDTRSSLLILASMLLFSSIIGLYLNYMVLPSPTLNFLLIGMGFSTVFANMISERQLAGIMNWILPDCHDSESRRSLGLPSCPGRRCLYGRLHSFPGCREIRRSLVWGGHYPCAQNCPQVPWTHASSPFRRFPYFYRDCRLGASRTGAGMRARYPGYHCRSGCHQ